MTLLQEQERLKARGKTAGNFCWQQNEAFDVFQNILGSTGFRVYANLTRKAYGYNAKFAYSARGLAAEFHMSHSTVARELRVLENLQMVRIRAGGGSQQSQCELIDLKELAERLGAKCNKGTGRFELPQMTTDSLKARVTELRSKLQGKNRAGQETGNATPAQWSGCVRPCASFFAPASKRDAGVTPESHQHHTRETQTGSHLLRENRTQENTLSPTPFNLGDLWKTKSNTFPYESGMELSWPRALACFSGVIDELKCHLMTDRPRVAHLKDGYDDWLLYGFNDIGLEAATVRGSVVELVLSAPNPDKAREGLEKYRKKWETSTRRWFGCQVRVEWLDQQPR